jgi:hypothetical protein
MTVIPERGKERARGKASRILPGSRQLRTSQNRSDLAQDRFFIAKNPEFFWNPRQRKDKIKKNRTSNLGGKMKSWPLLEVFSDYV